MSRYWFALCAAVVVATASAIPARAQSTLGFGSKIVIPVVAQTGSYSTEVFVQSPVGAAIPTFQVNVTFVEATTSTTPGVKVCTPFTLNSNTSVSFQLVSQCSLGAGSRFGYLVLEDASAQALDLMFAYSRTQNPQAIGFSVEGFPVGNLSAQSQRVNGLKRAAAPVPFQTNCFVGSLDKAVDYAIRLRDATGAQIGSSVTGHLDAHQMRRHLDIFAAAGLAGDFANVSAQINTTNASAPGNRDHPLFLSFCTVQDNVSFGADFRIGKAFDAFDATHTRDDLGCTPAGCGAYDYALPDATKIQVFPYFVRPPDAIRCDLLSDRLADLQIQLRDPRSIGDCDFCYLPDGSAAATTTPGTIVAGGANATTFYYETGPDVIRPSDGALLRTRWSIEVSARSKVPPPAGPIPYSIACYSGNGIFHVAPVTQNAGP